MTEPASPAEVVLEATRASLRGGRLLSAAVIERQLAALAEAGYSLQPRRYDDGADLMLKAARRALRGGHFAPAAVVERQLAALEEAGHTFVLTGGTACESFEWGPDSFEACATCGASYWKHAEGAGRVKGAHRHR